MKVRPFAFGVALVAVFSSGLSQASLGSLFVSGSPVRVVAKADPPIPLAASSERLRLAGMLLMDEDFLGDPQDAAVDEEVIDSDIQVNQVKQESRSNRGNTQQANIGKASNSSTSGQVRTRGIVNSLSQQQSGRNNKQVVNVGAITNSRTEGAMKMKSHLGEGTQRQSGISNNQGMNFGSVR